MLSFVFNFVLFLWIFYNHSLIFINVVDAKFTKSLKHGLYLGSHIGATGHMGNVAPDWKHKGHHGGADCHGQGSHEVIVKKIVHHVHSYKPKESHGKHHGIHQPLLIIHPGKGGFGSEFGSQHHGYGGHGEHHDGHHFHNYKDEIDGSPDFDYHKAGSDEIAARLRKLRMFDAGEQVDLLTSPSNGTTSDFKPIENYRLPLNYGYFGLPKDVFKKSFSPQIDMPIMKKSYSPQFDSPIMKKSSSSQITSQISKRQRFELEQDSTDHLEEAALPKYLYLGRTVSTTTIDPIFLRKTTTRRPVPKAVFIPNHFF